MREIFAKNKKGGITLVEGLVVIFLFLVAFTALAGAFQLALKVVGRTKNKVIATSIAVGEMEKIKNLDYSKIGVAGSFPDGELQAQKTITSNNVTFTINTRVDYVIDSADGISAPDDECPNDYKRVSIEVSWPGIFGGSVNITEDIAPETVAQECAQTGGILKVNVFNAYGQMVSFPVIEVKDPETDEVVKSATPSEGSHFFALPPDNYRIEVSKEGYSSERTYGFDEIAIPEKPNPDVLDKQLTELSFSIDKTSSFQVDTLSPWGSDFFSDSFLDQSKISDISNVEISGGKAILQSDEGGYKSSGYLVSVQIAPADLINWESFSFNDNEPSGTQLTYQILYFDGVNWVLIPDSDLPGNSVGFSVSPVDLSSLDVSSYPKIKLKANFSTTNNSFTPSLFDWQVSWKNSQPTPIPNTTFHLQGEKIIGKTSEEEPVYKFSDDFTSDSNGHIDISNLEWDSYTFSVNPATGLDLKDTEPSPQPISLSPDTTLQVKLYLQAQNSLLLTVKDTETGEPIFAASCRLYKQDLSFDKTQYTDHQGKIYFIPLESGTYILEVQAEGYEDKSDTFSISGDKTKIISLDRVE